MGPYPETPAGYKYIFVVTDQFSRWVEAFPTTATTTSEAIRIMEEARLPPGNYHRQRRSVHVGAVEASVSTLAGGDVDHGAIHPEGEPDRTA
jgi:hypothetical protein